MALRTCNGQHLWAVPYPQELNGVPMIMARQMDARDFFDLVLDNFEGMLVQSEATPLVMGPALRPCIVGQPYRLRHLRRALQRMTQARKDGAIWFTTPGAITRHMDTMA